MFENSKEENYETFSVITIRFFPDPIRSEFYDKSNKGLKRYLRICLGVDDS